jgi:argonaute-like protein implicated in RNA metabolism and viral defense
MNYKFYSVGNDLKKATAFANSLDSDFIRQVQRQSQSDNYVNSLDAVRELQKEGWELQGVKENKHAKTRKTLSHMLQMRHPDFVIRDAKGKVDAVASITINNSTTGDRPLEASLGSYRLVCSNGLIRHDEYANAAIQHTSIGIQSLEQAMSRLNRHADIILQEFNKLKQKDLTPEQIKTFATEAAKLRYNEAELSEINIDDLLAVHRYEDAGNDMWRVFNRVQENLTHDIVNPYADIKLNRELTELATVFAN